MVAVVALACEGPTAPVFDNPLDVGYIGPIGPVVASSWSTGVRLEWRQGTEPVDGYVVERASSLNTADDGRFQPLSGLIREPMWFADSTLTDLRARQYRIRGLGLSGPLHSSILTVEFPRFTLPVKDTEYPIAVAFSADGRFVATSHGNRGIDPHHGSVVRVWDVAGRQEIHRFLSRTVGESPSFGGSQTMLPMAFSPDGRYLVFADHVVEVYDLNEGRRIAEFYPEGYHRVGRISFHPDGQTVGLLLGTYGLLLDIRRLSDGRQVTFQHDATDWGNMRDAAFTEDGRHFVMAFEEKIRSWRVSDWTIESTLNLPSPARYAKISDDGRHIATWNGPSLNVWDRAESRLQKVLPLTDYQSIYRVSVSDDHSLFATRSVPFEDWTAPHALDVYRLNDGSHYRSLPPLHDLHVFAGGRSQVFAFLRSESAIWNFDETWRATAGARQ